MKISKELGEELKNKFQEKFPTKNLTNKKFNFLYVLGYLGEYKWLCKCDCGNYATAYSINLINNRDQSCGCKRIYLSKSSEYIIWKSMKARCYNPNCKEYPYYGGRGIIVCDRWKDSFANFIKDVGNRPSSEYSLDRIKNNENYEPGNVRWATKIEQIGNRRNTVTITYKNETKPLSQFCRDFNLSWSKVYKRIHRDKWSVENALETP